MARGAAQAQKKRRPQRQPKQKRQAQSWEDQLFFARLRRHAKWMFVLLALVFGVGFVAFGVGSGSSGISDILQGSFFGGGSGTGSRIKDDQKKIKANPRNIDAYRDLAALYQQKQQTSQAVATLERAAKIQPKNLDVLGDLARLYRGQAESVKNDAAAAQNELASRAVTPPGVDLNSTLGQALGSDPLTQSLRTKATEAFSKLTAAFTKTEKAYQRVATAARGTSQEANAQLQLGSLAVEAVQITGQQNDIVVAVNAYKRYLKLEPRGVSASQARQTLAQLQTFLPKAHR
jgi:tetratricopeptide (TPR) repeat protein